MLALDTIDWTNIVPSTTLDQIKTNLTGSLVFDWCCEYICWTVFENSHCCCRLQQTWHESGPVRNEAPKRQRSQRFPGRRHEKGSKESPLINSPRLKLLARFSCSQYVYCTELLCLYFDNLDFLHSRLSL